MSSADRGKVLLLENIHPRAAQQFEEAGFEVELLGGALQGDDLIAKISDANFIGVRSKTQITEDILEHATELKAIGCFCIGTNQVALEKANSMGIPVFNAPFSNTRSVAELIMAEVVMLARRLGNCVQELHNREWNKSAKGCHEVRGKTLGVIGYGHIGSQVGVLAEAFGMRVQFFDIAKKLPMGNNQSVGSLEKLLATSDFVTLHVPATPLTEKMIGSAQLATMKAGSFLLNASRGTVVDLDALAESLRSGHLAGAAVDVYPTEPRTNGAGFETPLTGLPNVVLTPHIGGSTEEAQESIGDEVSAAGIAYLLEGRTSTSVNFPKVQLPLREGSHRIVNSHRNVPGVMAEILKILADLKVNIHAQQLATDDNIGYLVADLDQNVSQQVRDAIAALPTSIKTRILQ